MKSPCPQCGTELFSRRLRRSWREPARCPDCGQRLTNDPRARALAASSLLLVALFHAIGRSALSSALGDDAGPVVLIVSISIYAFAMGLLIYSIIAFPYVRADDA